MCDNPLGQNVLAGIILGLGPGMCYSITLLDAGGGPANYTQMVKLANSVLYACASCQRVWFVVGWFSGSVVTTFGPKLTLMFGTLGYPIYVGSLWYFTNKAREWFPIATGAFLGLTANIIWAAAAYVSFSYSTEGQRGSFISMQWGLLSVFSLLGSIVAFGINFNARVVQVPISVYAFFLVVMTSAFFVALFTIIQLSQVRWRDGTPLAHYPHEGFGQELKNQRQMFRDWRILVLFIPMFASEHFTSTYVPGLMLDNKKIRSRRTRGLITVAAIALLVVAGWAGLTAWLYQNPLDPLDPPLFDWKDGPFGGFLVLNLIFGVMMVVYQVVVQWIISTFTNDPEQLARLAGLVKGVLASGVAAAFGTEAAGLTQLNASAYNFTVQAVGLVLMGFIAWKCVNATNYHKEENVIPPKDQAERPEEKVDI
ncbi:MAG: hypothetical protein Q9173_003335 [Seirophora scorigena]